MARYRLHTSHGDVVFTGSIAQARAVANGIARETGHDVHVVTIKTARRPRRKKAVKRARAKKRAAPKARPKHRAKKRAAPKKRAKARTSKKRRSKAGRRHK